MTAWQVCMGNSFPVVSAPFPAIASARCAEHGYAGLRELCAAAAAAAAAVAAAATNENFKVTHASEQICRPVSHVAVATTGSRAYETMHNAAAAAAAAAGAASFALQFRKIQLEITSQAASAYSAGRCRLTGHLIRTTGYLSTPFRHNRLSCRSLPRTV